MDCSYLYRTVERKRCRGQQQRFCIKFSSLNTSCAILAPIWIPVTPNRAQTSSWSATTHYPSDQQELLNLPVHWLNCWTNSQGTHSSSTSVPSSNKSKPNTAQNLLPCFHLIWVWHIPLPAQHLDLPPSNDLHAECLCCSTNSSSCPLLQGSCT